MLLKNLHDLIHKIPLPKTTKAKNATITMDDLLQAQKLTDTTCSSLQNAPRSMQLTTISEQLEAISAHIGIPAAVLQPGAKHSYAATLSAPASPKPPHHNIRFDLTLAQANHNRPVLLDLSNNTLIDKIHAAVTEAECWYEVRPLSPDREGNPDEEYVLPDIRAVGRHRSSNIWIATVTESECDFLVRSAH